MSESELTNPPAIRAASGESEVAIASQGGPVVLEARLTTLSARPQLLPAMVDAAPVEPAPARIRWRWLFAFTVVLPMAAASVYLLAFAAPRYTSSASFIVRAAAPTVTIRLPR